MAIAVVGKSLSEFAAIRTGLALALLCLALAAAGAAGLGGNAWAGRSDNLMLLGIGLAGLVLGRRAGLSGQGPPRSPTSR